MKAVFSAVILALLFLNAPAVHACSCGNLPAVCSSFQSAHAVFIGVVQTVDSSKVKIEDGTEFIVGQVAVISSALANDPFPTTNGSPADEFNQLRAWVAARDVNIRSQVAANGPPNARP